MPFNAAPGLTDPHVLADPDSRFAELSGIDVHYKVTGGNGPGVVLLHHFYGNVWTWRHVMGALSGEARVVAFDRPAFGLTQRPRRSQWNGHNPYTRTAASDITVGLMDHLGMERAVLVGSSAGGTIALETYARHPDRVEALILLSPAITGDVGPPARFRPWLRSPTGRLVGPRIVRRLGAEITVERVGRSWFNPSHATPEDVEAYRRPLELAGWDLAFWDVVTAEDPPHLSDLLPHIDVPTLVVAGEGDRVVHPDWSRRTAATIPGARFATIPCCGHTPQEECPKALVALIREFLTDLPH